VVGITCAVLAVLTLIAGPAFYYFEYFKPKEYLLDWMDKSGVGVPPMSFSIMTDEKKSRRFEFGYGEQCGQGCKEDVIGQTYQWTNQAHLGMAKADVAQCYRNGCIRYFRHEGHTMKLWFDKVGASRYQFTVILTY
jgi:hypothetical protein